MTLPPVRAKLNPEWSSYIEESLREMFGTMLQMDLTACLKPHPVMDVTALVGLTGSVSALFTIRCSYASAGAFAARMLDMDAVEDEEHIFDALGEICNIVAGNFKAKLRSFSDTCCLSLPTVISGEDYELHPPSGGQELELHVKCGGFPLSASLHLNE